MAISLKTLAEIDSSLESKKVFLSELFEEKIEDIFVFILSNEDFSKLKQPEWIKGFAFPRKNLIFVMEQNDSGKNKEEWLSLIVHEMVHLFYVAKFKTSEPAWFFEGLACYLAGQKKKPREIQLKDLLANFSEPKQESYVLGFSILKKIFPPEK